MKKKITIALMLLFAGASLFAQTPHHKKDKHKEIKKEYKRHHNRHDYHKNTTVIVQPSAPSPPSVEIQVSAPPPPRPPSVEIQLPSPPPPPRPPR